MIVRWPFSVSTGMEEAGLIICTPMLATGPVIGPATAMVSAPSARAGRARRPNESAASETTSVVFIMAFSREGLLAFWRGRRAELCARIGQLGNVLAREVA